MPSRRANSACVSPLTRQASTSSPRRAAGLIRRPIRSRLSPVSTSSVVNVVLVTITQLYDISTLPPMRHPKRRLQLVRDVPPGSLRTLRTRLIGRLVKSQDLTCSAC
jgi:hypothetical protein